MCVTNYLNHTKIANPPSWRSFARLGLRLCHRLDPSRKSTVGFSVLSQLKMGKKENLMFFLMRKPQNRVERSGGASDHFLP